MFLASRVPLILLLVYCGLTVSRFCPQVKVIDKFDMNAYMGIWYEYTKYPSPYDFFLKCTYVRYQNMGGNVMSVMKTQNTIFTDNPLSGKGYLKLVAPGQLLSTFRDEKAAKPNYLILGTDYTSFAVVYNCVNKNESEADHLSIYLSNFTEALWILTRQRHPAPETISVAKAIMDENKLSKLYLMDTVQTGCSAINAVETGIATTTKITTTTTTTTTTTETSSEESSEKDVSLVMLVRSLERV